MYYYLMDFGEIEEAQKAAKVAAVGALTAEMIDKYIGGFPDQETPIDRPSDSLPRKEPEHDSKSN